MCYCSFASRQCNYLKTKKVTIDVALFFKVEKYWYCLMWTSKRVLVCTFHCQNSLLQKSICELISPNTNISVDFVDSVFEFSSDFAVGYVQFDILNGNNLNVI